LLYTVQLAYPIPHLFQSQKTNLGKQSHLPSRITIYSSKKGAQCAPPPTQAITIEWLVLYDAMPRSDHRSPFHLNEWLHN